MIAATHSARLTATVALKDDNAIMTFLSFEQATGVINKNRLKPLVAK